MQMMITNNKVFQMILFIWLSLLSVFYSNNHSCNMKQIAIFFFLLLFYVVRVTIKDNLKVTFDTKQMTTITNILISKSIYSIVLVYQGLLYTLYTHICIWYRVMYVLSIVIVLTLLYVMFVFVFLWIRKEKKKEWV
jgi:hypothetical protein